MKTHLSVSSNHELCCMTSSNNRDGVLWFGSGSKARLEPAAGGAGSQGPCPRGAQGGRARHAYAFAGNEALLLMALMMHLPGTHLLFWGEQEKCIISGK